MQSDIVENLLFTVTELSMTMTTVVSLTLIAFSSISQVHTLERTECCHDIGFSLVHSCSGYPYEYKLKYPMWTTKCWVRDEQDRCTEACWSKFCADGSRWLNHCGVGKCERFGCDCKGGCRKNHGISEEDMKQKWLEQHGFTMNVTVEFHEKKSWWQDFFGFFKF